MKSKVSFTDELLQVPNCEQYSLFHVITGIPMKVVSIKVLSREPLKRFRKISYFLAISGIKALVIGP